MVLQECLMIFSINAQGKNLLLTDFFFTAKQAVFYILFPIFDDVYVGSLKSF